MSDPRRRYVHLVVHHDGAPASRNWRVPLGLWRALLGLGALALLSVLVALVFLGPIVRAAGRVPGLEQRVRNLELENARIAELATALDSLQLAYERVRGMMGADIVPDLSSVADDRLPVAPPVEARLAGGAAPQAGPSAPTWWPIRDAGFITRGLLEGEGEGEEHPGVDIALAIGTPVRAAGGGTVSQAGADAEYGRFVLIAHPDGLESMYGHLDRVLVSTGATVGAGDVVGLSGNSGRSTAPHLHFEVRRDGRHVDPLPLITEGR